MLLLVLLSHEEAEIDGGVTFGFMAAFFYGSAVLLLDSKNK